MTREEIMQAVARGWCHGSNRYKTMDSTLAEAIADEVQAALSPPSAAAVPSEQLEEAITHICNWFTYQNDHWKHTLGDLIRANVGPLLAGFPVADAAAQPKAPSPSEYGPLIPSLGPIKMPEPDQELPPFYTKPPDGEGVQVSEKLQVRKVEITSDRYQRDGVERWFLNDVDAVQYIHDQFDIAEVGEKLTVTMVCDEMTRQQMQELICEDD